MKKLLLATTAFITPFVTPIATLAHANDDALLGEARKVATMLPPKLLVALQEEERGIKRRRLRVVVRSGNPAALRIELTRLVGAEARPLVCARPRNRKPAIPPNATRRNP